MPKKKAAKKATSAKRVKGRTTKKARSKSSTSKTAKRTTKRPPAKKKAAQARGTKSTPANKKPPSVRVEFVWQTELARIFGTTARNVQRWTEQGMPRHDDGSYPLTECVAWRRERDLEEARPKTLQQAQFRKAAAEAEIAELKLAQLRSETMTVDAYKDAIGGAFTRVRSIVLTLPQRAAPDLLGLKTLAEIKAVLEQHLADVLQELHNGDDIPNANGSDHA